LGEQTACIDNEIKIVESPAKGQCDWNDDNQKPSYIHGSQAIFMFNLTADPTESSPLGKEKHGPLYGKYTKLMDRFKQSVTRSGETESLCIAPTTVTP